MKLRTKAVVAALALLPMLFFADRQSGASLANVTARRLADTITGGSMSAQGSCKGVIDMTRASGSFNTISVAELNALIADNDGALVVVVDVNEANGGLETARAQGVAVKRAELKVAGVTVGGGTVNPAANQYPFSTQTQAQVAAAGSTTRQTYYTLLGDAGSNEITPRNVDGKVFDSTIRIPVNGSIAANATDIKLYIEFLKTDISLGDPEDFYDCNGGAEDLAIVPKGVTTYFDQNVPTTTAFRTESPSVEISPEGLTTTQTTVAAEPTYSWVSVPGTSTFKMVGYEDLYPNQGDYDFNDAIIAYRYALRVNGNGLVDQVRGEAYLIARGSNYSHEWNLAIPVAGLSGGNGTCATVMGNGNGVPKGRECTITATGGSIAWRAFDATRILMPPTDASKPQQNTSGGVVAGPRSTFVVALTTPVPLSSFGEDDPWLRVIDTNQEIHLSTRAGSSPLPYALVVPSDFQITSEEIDLLQAYPRFGTFVSSGGSQHADWYRWPSSGKVVDWQLSSWAWANAL